MLAPPPVVEHRVESFSSIGPTIFNETTSRWRPDKELACSLGELLNYFCPGHKGLMWALLNYSAQTVLEVDSDVMFHKNRVNAMKYEMLAMRLGYVTDNAFTYGGFGTAREED